MHNLNSDPNLVVLQNYFRKIKSAPETSEEKHEETAVMDSPEKLNAFAGFGPIVRTANNKKKSSKYSHKKKRPGRKIFLTVDEAFSDSDFGHFGREMRERDDNYLIYVPVLRPVSNHTIPTPQQVHMCVRVNNKKRQYIQSVNIYRKTFLIKQTSRHTMDILHRGIFLFLR